MKLGLCSTIFIVLLVLKLCALITISWLWVFMPLIVMAVFWTIVAFLVILYGAVTITKELKK